LAEADGKTMETPNEMRISILIAFASFMLVLIGCTVDRPMVRMAKGVTLSNYRGFAVEVTKNGTGTPLPAVILEEITEQLRSKLAERGIKVYADNGDEQGVVVLRSTLVSFEVTKSVVLAILPGSKDECIIHAELIDKHTNQALGDFVARGTTAGGGPIVLATAPETRMIDMAAASIAEEIARHMGKR
jgi:hypothetical protein